MTKFLDETEDVIPTPTIQSGGDIAKFVENLVHLKGCKDIFNQYRRTNTAMGNSKFVLGKFEYVIPPARLKMIFQLR